MFCIRLPCAVCGRRNRQVAGQTRRSATGDRSGVRRGARRSATRRYEPRRVGARAHSVTRAQMTTQRDADVRFAGCASSRYKERAVPARGWSGQCGGAYSTIMHMQVMHGAAGSPRTTLRPVSPWHAHPGPSSCRGQSCRMVLSIYRREFRLDLSRKMRSAPIKIVTRAVWA